MSETSWRDGWGYASIPPIRPPKVARVEESELSPKVPKHSRWARMSEIQAAFTRCELRGRDTVVDKGGFPVWSNGAESYLDTSMNHVLIVASTNRHKTRGALMPTIAVTAMERKVSYVIHDPKGELYRYLSGLLRSMGIDVRVVNFRDPECGDCWNMLTIPYRLWKSGKVSKAKAILTDIAALLSPIDTKTSNDLFWPSAGQYTLLGFMYALMELSQSEEEANFSNLISIIRSASVDEDTFARFADRFNKDSDVVTMLSTAMNNGENTRRCIMGMVYNALAKLVCNESLASMMASNQIDLASVGTKPTAIFLITPDEKNTYNPIVGQFVSQAYQELIAQAQLLGGTLPVRVNFLLDEFASLDRIEDIPNMLAAGRSRNIRCMLVIQSVAQLKSVYGDIADSIMNNCADWIYLGGRDTEFMNLLCTLSGNDSNGSPLMTSSQLMHLEKGKEAFVLIDGMYPFIGRIADISEYDIGTMELSEPIRRQDHKAPTILGDKVFSRRPAHVCTVQSLYAEHEDDDTFFPPSLRVCETLGPKSTPADVSSVARGLYAVGCRNAPDIGKALYDLSQMLASEVRVEPLLKGINEANNARDLESVMDSLNLKLGVSKAKVRRMLKEIQLLLA